MHRATYILHFFIYFLKHAIVKILLFKKSQTMLKFEVTSGFFKALIGWLVVFTIRMIPFRPPNIEPIMSTLMPFSKKYGVAGGFFFAFFSMIIFDIATINIGIWTIATAIAYGFVGLAANIYFRNRENKALEYLKFSLIATIAYDLITGPGLTYLAGHSLSFNQALIGQIPFTMLHLLGNGILAFTLSPLIYRWIVSNSKLEVPTLFNRLSFSRR